MCSVCLIGLRWSGGSVFDFEKWGANEPNDAFGSEKCGILLGVRNVGYCWE